MASRMTISSGEEALQNKEWVAGSWRHTDPVPMLLVADGQYSMRESASAHSPAQLQMFLEYIVNASDHRMEFPEVNRIEVALDTDPASPDYGVFAVRNNGPGFSLTPNDAASEKAGRPVYDPEIALYWLHSGSNVKKAEESVKGGINGIGAKFARANSEWLTVETVDAALKQRYFQRYENASPLPAALAPCRSSPFTQFRFRPRYDRSHYCEPGGSPAPADMLELEGWVRLQCEMVSVYLCGAERAGARAKRPVVVFNDRECRCTGPDDLALLMALMSAPDQPAEAARAAPAEAPRPRVTMDDIIGKHVVRALPTGKAGGFPLQVGVVIKAARDKYDSLGIFNGVMSTEGNYNKWIRAKIAEGVRACIKTKYKKAVKLSPDDICRHACVVVCGPLPGATWGDQSKKKLQVALKVFNGFEIPEAGLKKITDSVAEAVYRQIAPRSAKVKIDKFEAADCKDPARCTLILPEGDSALGMVRTMLLAKAFPWLSPEFYATLSLGGKPMNLLKSMVTINSGIFGKREVPNEQFNNNKTFTAIIQAIGLSYAKTYESDEEFATLKYHQILLCTDQDVDGIHIQDLVLVFFARMWPALPFRRGFFKVFNTPVVRRYTQALRSGAVLEFFSEAEHDRWLEASRAAGDGLEAKFKHVHFYKGLAGHNRDEIKRIAKNFDKSVHTFEAMDYKKALERINVFYGKDTEIRKDALRVRPLVPTDAQLLRIRETGKIGLDFHLNTSTKEFMEEFRNIYGVFDGFKTAHRKVLCYVHGQSYTKERKVFQLTGSVAEKMFYHHGGASMDQTIVRMTQQMPSKNQYPFLFPDSSIGNVEDGGARAGQSRYVSVRALKWIEYVFPQADWDLLDVVEEEGEEAEAVSFMPVLPWAVLESKNAPGTGWAYEIHARDLGFVAQVVRVLVGGGDPALAEFARRLHRDINDQRRVTPEMLAAPELRTYLLPLSKIYRNVKRVGGALVAIPLFEFVEERSGRAVRTVIDVTWLPPSLPPVTFIAKLADERHAAAPFLLDAPRSLDADRVHVRIRLRPEKIAELAAAQARFDAADRVGLGPVVEFLGGDCNLNDNINLLHPDCWVMEFGGSYLAPVLYWFVERGAMYSRRYEREVALLRLRKERQDHLVRFLEDTRLRAEIDGCVDEAAMCALLRAGDYVRFNSALLDAPGRTRVEDLERLIREPPRAAGDRPDAGFGYILRLGFRDAVRLAVARRRAALVALAGDLVEAERNLANGGRRAWLAEIDLLEEKLAAGLKNNWKHF